MTAPPGSAPVPTARRGASNREIRRELADRINAAARRSDVQLLGWQVRSMAATLMANRETPTDQQITLALMTAPWWPKPRVRRFGVGDPGWRVRT